MAKDILWTKGQFNGSGADDRIVCLAIAVIGSEMPTELVGAYGLDRRRHMRGNRAEYRFYYRERWPRLPILRDGQISLARWGNGKAQSRHLPRTGWTWHASIEEGLWRGSGAIRVDI